MFTALIASFIYGCKVGWTSWTTTLFMSADSPLEVSESDISLMVSISYTGTIISVIVCYTVTSKVSRKQILLACTLIYAITWLLILTTSSINIIIYCFFAYGISASMLVIINMIYIGEIASPKNRELIGASYAVATCIGIEVEYLMSSFNNYRWMAWFPLLICGVAFISSSFMIESPYYLMYHGMEEKAIKNYCWLNGKTDPDDMTEGFEGVTKYVTEQKHMEKNKLRVIFEPSNLKLLIILLLINGTSIMQCNTIVTQTGSLMIRDFEGLVDGTIFVNAYHILRVIMAFLGYVTVKKFERRSLILYGLVIMGLIQVGCAMCYFAEARNDNKIEYLAVIIEFLLMAVLLLDSITLNVGYAILKIEIFPHLLKEFYTSMLAFMNDCFGFAVVKSYFALYSVVGNGVLVMAYAGVMFFNAALVYLFIWDTKGKTLHQIRIDYKSCSENLKEENCEGQLCYP